ncbi:nucleoside triphosphate pyrophosphohydrolase family protein [Methylobacter psychrophilus]|uniref:nucleoside triphosphate pyrophosphohydrolase family protein n=1 Tax=Methylobacter psychrophilus TaxID=96941 RepID=UPI0021D4FA65|nr:nucleoside triphosphate pyrophosphohydrolase family protein [Methylobacter psychrophilus]
MNKNLQLVREFHDVFSCRQAQQGANLSLSEMDIILRQGLLMEEGSQLFKAFKAGDMVAILAAMINLSYCALQAIAIAGADVLDRPVAWQHDGHIISLMRLFSDKINHCTSGNPEDYSAVYCLCAYLSRSFINADFDKAFQMIHDGKMSQVGDEQPEEIPKHKVGDLSDCLYE